MTSVEELRNKILDLSTCGGNYSGCCGKDDVSSDMIDALIQAVRDEEFDMHCIATCAYKSTKEEYQFERCNYCEANKTRYCP